MLMDLVDSILLTLPYKYAQVAPDYFRRYAPGAKLYYTTYIHSRHTQWYVFFSRQRRGEETVLIVHYISNNHVDGNRLLSRR